MDLELMRIRARRRRNHNKHINITWLLYQYDILEEIGVDAKIMMFAPKL